MKYHYEYEVRASNLNYGGFLIGVFRSKGEAYRAGQFANRGVFTIQKIRVYE